MAKKEISIRRKRPGVSILPDNVIASAVTKISSQFRFGRPLKGLTKEQEREYLPLLQPIDPDEKTWARDCDTFWAEFNIPVDSDGKTLEVGLKADGTPENLKDWVAYQFALAHSAVANSEEEMKANPASSFYIFDPELKTIADHGKVTLKAEAYAAFTRIKNADNGVLQLKRILRLNGLNPDSISEQAIENLIANFLEATPAKFLKIATSTTLADAALVEELVDRHVVQKLGSIYQFNDVRIGDSRAEAVAYIGSEKNSGTLIQMLAKLQEKRKDKGQEIGDLRERLGLPSDPEEVIADQEVLDDAASDVADAMADLGEVLEAVADKE